jgi:hypothetical protein
LKHKAAVGGATDLVYPVPRLLPRWIGRKGMAVRLIRRQRDIEEARKAKVNQFGEKRCQSDFLTGTMSSKSLRSHALRREVD